MFYQDLKYIAVSVEDEVVLDLAAIFWSRPRELDDGKLLRQDELRLSRKARKRGHRRRRPGQRFAEVAGSAISNDVEWFFLIDGHVNGSPDRGVGNYLQAHCNQSKCMGPSLRSG